LQARLPLEISLQVDDIRVFIPSKDYLISQGFYQAEFANNLMLQLSVVDINQAFALTSTLEG
tara:strand:- start:1 stop:186 length:186 start_codon:yes stop_codon:yes gene_type:complete